MEWLRDYENRLYLELYIAYLEARIGGKRSTGDEHRFEVNAAPNLLSLTRSLNEKTYAPSRGVAHVINNPVKREIFAAPFRDRIIHHWIYDKIYDWWDARFIYDSYSCRVGKGTLKGIQRLDQHVREVSQNGAVETWVIQLDLKGYFMSLPRKKLYERAAWGLEKQYKGIGQLKSKEYELLKYALQQTIFDDPTKGVRRRGWPEAWEGLPPEKSMFCQPPGRGMVIGNLTSQLLSNVYLDQLDRHVVYELGYRHYGRYVDDFYIVVTAEKLPQALKDVREISSFVQRLGLSINEKKTKVKNVKQGIEFLGGVVYPGRIYPGTRLKRNFYDACVEFSNGRRGIETIESYEGHMRHFEHDKIMLKIMRKTGVI